MKRLPPSSKPKLGIKKIDKKKLKPNLKGLSGHKSKKPSIGGNEEDEDNQNSSYLAPSGPSNPNGSGRSSALSDHKTPSIKMQSKPKFKPLSKGSNLNLSKASAKEDSLAKKEQPARPKLNAGGFNIPKEILEKRK